jgi:hypothetical protein
VARRLVHAALTAQRRSERRLIDRQRDKQEASVIAKRIKIAIVLDMLCPNGKRLRFCSGREVRVFGDAFTSIGQRVGDDQLVGEVLLEAEARALLALEVQ